MWKIHTDPDNSSCFKYVCLQCTLWERVLSVNKWGIGRGGGGHTWCSSEIHSDWLIRSDFFLK